MSRKFNTWLGPGRTYLAGAALTVAMFTATFETDRWFPFRNDNLHMQVTAQNAQNQSSETREADMDAAKRFEQQKGPVGG